MMSDFSYEYTSVYCSSTLPPLGVIIFLLEQSMASCFIARFLTINLCSQEPLCEFSLWCQSPQSQSVLQNPLCFQLSLLIITKEAGYSVAVRR